MARTKQKKPQKKLSVIPISPALARDAELVIGWEATKNQIL